MNKYVVHLSRVMYDTDGQAIANLPTKFCCEVEAINEDSAYELAMDILSGKTGWCIYSCNSVVKRIK